MAGSILYNRSMPESKVYRLGTRAFLFFLTRRVKWPLIFLILLGALWTQRERVPIEYQIWSDYGINVLFLIWIGFAVFMLLRSFFEYRGYSFRFDEEFFHVTRGYFLKHEMGIVYHQIQHVTVKRGILDRAVGVGHLIIVTNSGGGESSTSEVVLPALEKNRARLVQRELLRKASGPARKRAPVAKDDEEEIDDVDTEDEENEDEESEE